MRPIWNVRIVSDANSNDHQSPATWCTHEYISLAQIGHHISPFWVKRALYSSIFENSLYSNWRSLYHSKSEKWLRNRKIDLQSLWKCQKWILRRKLTLRTSYYHHILKKSENSDRFSSISLYIEKSVFCAKEWKLSEKCSKNPEINL